MFQGLGSEYNPGPLDGIAAVWPAECLEAAQLCKLPFGRVLDGPDQ